MGNPFDALRTVDVATGYHTTFQGMQVGETRQVMMATKNGDNGRPDPASRTPKTITRTDRPFIADWVDSTNAEIEQRRPPTPMRWVFPDGWGMPPQLRDMRFYRED